MAERGRRRAASIYGTIVTAAVLAASGNMLTTAALEVAVLVTLVVYWLAEQYADLLGEHAHRGKLPSISEAASSLAATWPMVSASFIPLATLLVTRLLGASASGAADIALGVTIVLLVIQGYLAGRAARLRGVRLVLAAGTAGILGVFMVVLKVFLQDHH